LLLADADVGDQRVRILVQPDLAQQRGGLRADLVPVNDAVARLLVAEEDVLRDGEQRDEREFLVDDDDAAAFAVVNAGKPAFLPEEMDVAGIAAMRVDARKHLHQGRLAGAVLADDGEYFGLADIETDILERLDAGKGLGDAAHLQNGLCHRRPCREVKSSSLPAI
jgi:hypothetical protein